MKTFRFKTDDLKALRAASVRAGYGARVTFEVGRRNGSENLFGVDLDEHDLDDIGRLVAFHKYRLPMNDDGNADYDFYTYDVSEYRELQGNLWIEVRGGKLYRIRDMHNTGPILWPAQA